MGLLFIWMDEKVIGVERQVRRLRQVPRCTGPFVLHQMLPASSRHGLEEGEAEGSAAAALKQE